MDEQWDVLVIGGGAAGLSAALLLGRARRRVVVVDAGAPRNRFAAHMHGVLGNEGTDPRELIRRGRTEAAGYGVEFRDGRVRRLDETDGADGGIVATLVDGGVVRARAAVVATGLSDDLPEIPGLAQRWGTRVLQCPYCHGWEARDQRLGVLTTSPLGLHQAELVRQWSDRVTVFTAGLGPLDDSTEARLRSRGITLVAAPVVAISGDDDGPLTVRTEDRAETEVDAVFTMGTPRPHDDFLTHTGLDRADTPVGSVLAVDDTGRTSSERIWAVGNVVTPLANVPMSIGAGAVTGGAVNAALVGLDFDAAATEQLRAAPAGFWEERYAGTDRAWSGRPNHTLVDVAGRLSPGRALDLGCGEGADAVWLALRGWTVTGIDISPTAVDRAVEAARAAGVPAERVRFEAADLSTWTGEQDYDLVTASFLHSPVSLPRADILRHASELVAPGGHLLVISHAAAPPWAPPHEAESHELRFLTPDDELAALDVDEESWSVVLAETRTRPATGPDGERTELDDGVLLLRRD